MQQGKIAAIPIMPNADGKKGSKLMNSQNTRINNLLNANVALRCKLSDGIDPNQWAGLCSYLGRLNPDEFSAVALEFMKRHQNMKVALKRRIRSLVNQNIRPDPTDVPLVSSGPSGIRGQYQREID